MSRVYRLIGAPLNRTRFNRRLNTVHIHIHRCHGRYLLITKRICSANTLESHNNSNIAECAIARIIILMSASQMLLKLNESPVPDLEAVGEDGASVGQSFHWGSAEKRLVGIWGRSTPKDEYFLHTWQISFAMTRGVKLAVGHAFHRGSTGRR